MRKVDMIKRIVGKAIQPEGFVYAGFTLWGGWTFQRTVDGVVQEIAIERDRWSPDIRLMLSTSVRTERLLCRQITNDPRYSDIADYVANKTDEEFQATLHRFVAFIFEYGLDKFKEISVPLYQYAPTKAMCQDLYDHHEALVQSFQHKHHVENADIESSIKLLKELLEQNDEEQIYDEKTQHELTEMAAFHGEQVIKRYGGQWNQIGFLVGIKTLKTTEDILGDIVHCWEKKSVQKLEILSYALCKYEKLMPPTS